MPIKVGTHLKKVDMERTQSIPIIIFIIALGYFAYAMQYDFGTFKAPGIGFFPFFAGLGLVSIVTIFILKEWYQKFVEKELEYEEKRNGTMVFKTKIYQIILILIAFAVFHKLLGFWISILCSLILLCRIGGTQTWIRAFVTSLIVTIIAIILFEYLLGGVFPKGYFK